MNSSRVGEILAHIVLGQCIALENASEGDISECFRLYRCAVERIADFLHGVHCQPDAVLGGVMPQKERLTLWGARDSTIF